MTHSASFFLRDRLRICASLAVCAGASVVRADGLGPRTDSPSQTATAGCALAIRLPRTARASGPPSRQALDTLDRVTRLRRASSARVMSSSRGTPGLSWEGMVGVEAVVLWRGSFENEVTSGGEGGVQCYPRTRDAQPQNLVITIGCISLKSGPAAVGPPQP